MGTGSYKGRPPSHIFVKLLFHLLCWWDLQACRRGEIPHENTWRKENFVLAMVGEDQCMRGWLYCYLLVTKQKLLGKPR